MLGGLLTNSFPVFLILLTTVQWCSENVEANSQITKNESDLNFQQDNTGDDVIQSRQPPPPLPPDGKHKKMLLQQAIYRLKTKSSYPPAQEDQNIIVHPNATLQSLLKQNIVSTKNMARLSILSVLPRTPSQTSDVEPIEYESSSTPIPIIDVSNSNLKNLTKSETATKFESFTRATTSTSIGSSITSQDIDTIPASTSVPDDISASTSPQTVVTSTSVSSSISSSGVTHQEGDELPDIKKRNKVSKYSLSALPNVIEKNKPLSASNKNISKKGES